MGYHATDALTGMENDVRSWCRQRAMHLEATRWTLKPRHAYNSFFDKTHVVKRIAPCFALLRKPDES